MNNLNHKTSYQFHTSSETKPSNSLRALPMLIAVSCLSPVRIQILMSAFISVSMVSGTLSWSLSSIAVAPSSCRFYTQDEERTNRKGKKVTTEEGLENILWARIVSLTHFPLISCSCLSRRKTTKSFLGYWICYYACVCVCACACPTADTTSSICKAAQYSQCFIQETWWFFRAGCRLISGQNRVKDFLTRPRNRGETGASSRGKAGEALEIVTWALLTVHL